MFPLPAAVVLYCTVVGLFFLGVWLYFDRRDHERFERERRKTTFHCIRCDRLYTAAAGPDVRACPRCGHPNARLRF
jgi:hypothetical protein